MAIQNEPTRISTPFADAGTKNVIPETMPQPSATAAASWQAGFPTVCSLPLSAGGIPPARNDFNGLFNQMTQIERFLQDGGIFSWSADTDYGANRLVLGSDNKLYWSAAQSGPNTGAGAVDPTTDSGTYWGQLPVTAADAVYASVAGGFVSWSSSADYSASQIVLGSDGLIYTAKAASGPGTAAGAKNPTTDSGSYWGSLPMKTPGLGDDGNGLATTGWVKSLAAASVYLDPSGSDSNDGMSESSAVKTFSKAIAIAEKLPQSYIVFEVKTGSYNGNIEVRSGKHYIIKLEGDITVNGFLAASQNTFIQIIKSGGGQTTITFNASNVTNVVYVGINSVLLAQNTTININANSTSSHAVQITSESVALLYAMSISGSGINGGVICDRLSGLDVYHGINIGSELASGDAIRGDGSSYLNITFNNNTIHTSSNGPAILATSGSFLAIYGQLTIEHHSSIQAVASVMCSVIYINNGIKINANSCTSFFSAYRAGFLIFNNHDESILTGAVTASVLVYELGCVSVLSSATFSGTVTGKRYQITQGGQINVNGAGANVFPGSIAGTAASNSYAYYG